jgi:hypothetical protein
MSQFSTPHKLVFSDAETDSEIFLQPTPAASRLSCSALAVTSRPIVIDGSSKTTLCTSPTKAGTVHSFISWSFSRSRDIFGSTIQINSAIMRTAYPPCSLAQPSPNGALFGSPDYINAIHYIPKADTFTIQEAAEFKAEQKRDLQVIQSDELETERKRRSSRPSKRDPADVHSSKKPQSSGKAGGSSGREARRTEKKSKKTRREGSPSPSAEEENNFSSCIEAHSGEITFCRWSDKCVDRYFEDWVWEDYVDIDTIPHFKKERDFMPILARLVTVGKNSNQDIFRDWDPDFLQCDPDKGRRFILMGRFYGLPFYIAGTYHFFAREHAKIRLVLSCHFGFTDRFQERFEKKLVEVLRKKCSGRRLLLLSGWIRIGFGMRKSRHSILMH